MTIFQFGTVGFGYSEWVGSFFPDRLASAHFLAYYSQHFLTAELDSTFYGTPRASTVQGWVNKTPNDFVFCPKTPRDISHGHLLSGIAPMTQFVERMQRLGSKLGAILIQFPSSFQFEHEWDSLQLFLDALPTDARYAVEFRSPTWRRGRVLQRFRQQNIAWVATDSVYMPEELLVTADFTYLRFIGIHGAFPHKDREIINQTEKLTRWQDRLTPHLPQLKTVYGYFNNDYSGHSPITCNRFKQRFGLPASYPSHPIQGSLW